MATVSRKPAARAGYAHPPEELATLGRFFRKVPPEGGIDAGTLSDALRDLSSATARIALASIEGRLPAWSARRADGEFVRARGVSPPPARPVLLAPRHLFTINWADSGPGFSWPEAYHATYLPDFDLFVVTASQDSPDAYGVCDLAIGWFRGGEEVKSGVHRVITAWWRAARTSCDQGPWAYVLDTASVSEEEADAWRAEVWADETETDDLEAN